jgi:hypothetical protein
MSRRSGEGNVRTGPWVGPGRLTAILVISGSLALMAGGGAFVGPAAGAMRASAGSAAGRAADNGSNPRNTPNSALSACSDKAYSLYSNSWNKKLTWYFNAKSTPSGVNRDDAKGAIRGAVKVITHATNDCGLSDGMTGTAAFQDTTSTSVDINKDGSCKSGDGKSVVGFGTLPSSYLALTCWWTDSKGHTTEADIRFNKAHYSFTVDIPKGCTNKFSIKDVATHEFGHAFGLGHVSESKDGNLTMSPTMMACQTGETTLGLGDVLGLEAKY